MPQIGKVSTLQKKNELYVEWKIPDLDYLSKEDETVYWSPDFLFESEHWSLQMFPNGGKEWDSDGHIDVGLCREYANPPICIAFSFAFKTVNGHKDGERQKIDVIERDVDIYIDRLMSRLEYKRRKTELLSSGSLTVVSTLKKHNSTATEVCSQCNETFKTEEISFHEKKCRIKCPECLDFILYKNWPDHECQIQRAKAFEERTHNYKTLLLSGDHSDLTVKVKEVEFRLHKNILASQNPYFNAMFKIDMKETSTGVVKIEDCDPNVFQSFIYFIYTGEVDELSPENVCKLYEAADKYQENPLKKECLYFLLNHFSVDCFCDYFLLALRHDEKELFQKAVEFFISKRKEITRTAQWQTFVEENHAQSTELLMKALDHYDK